MFCAIKTKKLRREKTSLILPFVIAQMMKHYLVNFLLFMSQVSFFCTLFLLIFINEICDFISNDELRSARLRSYIYIYF